MFTGDIRHIMCNLNMVVVHEGFNVLDEFLVRRLGYKSISYVSHPAMAKGIGCFHKYCLITQVITLASPAKKVNDLHLILDALTMADMVYMTTGGVMYFYPQWLGQRVAICSCTSDCVQWDNKLRYAGEFHEDMRVETGMAFIGEMCRNRCPML